MSERPPTLIRRSNLVVPIGDAAAVESSWQHGADAVTLDLGLHGDRPADLLCVARAVELASRGGAEVFVRGSVSCVDAVLGSAAGGQLAGVMAAAETANDVRELDALLGARSLSIVVVLETPAAVWNVGSIVTASPSVSQAVLSEARLAEHLGVTPDVALDAFEYARGRVVVETTVAGVGPVGMSWPLSVSQDTDAPDVIERAAIKARNLGLKGAVCPRPSWIAPVNRAFSPAPETVAYYRKVREVFADGVAAGTAAVPFEGRMIDIPVDEWAADVLALAQACAARDAEKATALQQ